MKITKEYFEEKIEAYNVAIEALRHHEQASDGNRQLSALLRARLVEKLEREIDAWVAKYANRIVD